MSSANSENRTPRLVAALDVDGVLASWSEGWQGIYHFGPPIPGAVAFTHALSRNMRIIIHTCRCNRSMGMGNRSEVLAQIVTSWLQMHGFAFDEVWINPGKPVADVYIDDRAISCRPEDYEPGVAFEGTLKAIDAMFSVERRGIQTPVPGQLPDQNADPASMTLPGPQPTRRPLPPPDYRT